MVCVHACCVSTCRVQAMKMSRSRFYHDSFYESIVILVLVLLLTVVPGEFVDFSQFCSFAVKIALPISCIRNNNILILIENRVEIIVEM